MDRDERQTLGEPATDDAPAPTKRPYKAPQLRRLGSVRELTLGATMGNWAELGTGWMRTRK